MLGHDDLHAHFSGALHDCVEVINLEPQQYAISVRLVIAITDGTVMVFDFEPMQLKDKPLIPDQLLVFGPAMTTLAAQQALVPSATCFDIGYGDERLRAHISKPNTAGPTPQQGPVALTARVAVRSYWL